MAPIKFGVLMIEYQMLDAVGPLDILSSCSKKLIEGYEATVAPGLGLSDKSIDIEFYHINETLDPVTLTANAKMVPTVTCDDCPPLDYLLVGGPDPTTFKLSDRFSKFLRDHVAAGRGLFTTCTGAIAVAPSGVLDGKNATVNHMAVEYAKKAFPQVKWTKESQWVADGNIWTAGGACAGMDMMAHWVIENYGKDLAIFGFTSLDYQPRDVNRQLFDIGQASFTL
ncbi:DJ-1/PfpI family protein-like protein [Bisporella sp. PMI_857]|nr:DJ-1/PfpI family protein-like protein [Bisporella sp. PMI_857]